MKTDPRILPAEDIDRARTVLVDAHSLAALVKDLTQPTVANFSLVELTSDYAGRKLANVIQSIVLYETLVVDSLLFQIYSDVHIATEFFPQIIRGVYLRPMIREKIGAVVGNIARLETVGRPPPGISPQEWSIWQFQDGSEKPLMDKLADVVPDLIPPQYERDEEIQRYLEWNGSIPAGLPLCCTNSMMTLGRAHYYLELSRELGIPLSADPIRSRYFSVLFDTLGAPINIGEPERVVAYFEEKVLRTAIEEAKGLIPVHTLDLSIPAVTEYVVGYARQKQCSLYKATLEVRESKNATRFREWCARYVSLSGQGRAAAVEKVKLAKELQRVCDIWKNDINEEVKYKSRKLSLGEIPYIGAVLKALNMHEVSIKDRVIRPVKPYSYFLFLNDLLQLPKQ
jgi:hypothetical protein